MALYWCCAVSCECCVVFCSNGVFLVVVLWSSFCGNGVVAKNCRIEVLLLLKREMLGRVL